MPMALTVLNKTLSGTKTATLTVRAAQQVTIVMVLNHLAWYVGKVACLKGAIFQSKEAL